jgi:hypothetical protein
VTKERRVRAVAAAMAVVGSLAFAQSATADLRINEVESNGGTPGDWVEVLNTGATPVDIGGRRRLRGREPHEGAKTLTP